MAINPLPFLQATPDPGQAFMDSFQKARAARLAQDQALAKQQQQMQRQQQYAQWIQRLQTDRSPETLSQFMLQFPEQADAINKAFEPMNAQRKAQEVGFYGQTLSALDRGDAEYAKKLVNDRLAAARNTPGQEQTVAELEYGLEQIDQNPAALKAMLAATVQQLDPKAYDSIYAKSGDLTSFQKDLQAAGIDPNSEEGMAKARQYAELKVDPIVQMPTPQGGQFIGKQSEYYRMFGAGAPPPRIKQPPRIGEVRNGFAFTGGDPGVQSNWVKAKPLQETKAPELGSNGIPSVLTRAQYDAIVQVKGKSETDAWMLRNGVRLGGQ